MDALTPAALVHFYVTGSREILCGVRAFDRRSTKHPRQVTCQACVSLLGERPMLAAHASAEHAAGGAP